MGTLEKLNEIINAILEQEIKVDDATKFKELPEWDSIVQMTFFVTVENEFNVSIDIGEALEAETVGEFKTLIKS